MYKFDFIVLIFYFTSYFVWLFKHFSILVIHKKGNYPIQIIRDMSDCNCLFAQNMIWMMLWVIHDKSKITFFCLLLIHYLLLEYKLFHLSYSISFWIKMCFVSLIAAIKIYLMILMINDSKIYVVYGIQYRITL